MNYGAPESNSREGLGLVVFILGITIFFAGAAYGVGVVQILLDLIGLAGIVGGFVVLRAARTAE